MALTALVIGAVVGLIIALIRLYRIKILAPVLQVIVTVLKGVPVVLVILALYLISAKQFDIWAESMHWTLRFKDFNMVWIAIAALSLCLLSIAARFSGAHLRQSKGQRSMQPNPDRHDELYKSSVVCCSANPGRFHCPCSVIC